MVPEVENPMIIAESNQEVIWDWLEEYGKFVSTPYSETEKMIKKLGMFGDHWTRNGNMYLASMESLRIIIAKKTKALQKMA